VIEAIPAYLDRWGTHPSWSRMLGSPALYRQIETRLTDLLGAGDSLLLPTLTHIHASVIPVLASDGTIFVDARAHKTVWDGCVAARAHGATVVRYAHDDPEALERLLRRYPRAPRLVCMDGINSMTGNPPRLADFLALARASDALLYVDDAHGFGVIGERDRSETSPYGRRGNGVVRHLGESYDHLVLTGGFSKAYSSLLASSPARPSSSVSSRSQPPRTCTPAPPRSPPWPARWSGCRSARPGATPCGRCSGRGPGASSTTWRSWGRIP
jgi:8-amino-7-oxononanoate synthase